MDVSRIDAISPRQIEWRKLTAKEIIKYDNEGIEVPSQYLQWAKEFRQDIEAAQNDETTYEMATSGVLNNKQEQPEGNNIDANKENPEIPQENPNKNDAQLKRESLQKAGVSLRDQTKEFTKDSNDASKEVIQSASNIDSAKENSESEIQALEGNMQELLSKAETVQSDLKSEILAINSGRSDRSTFAKIDKLQKQLEQYGVDGQNQIADSESDFNIYRSTVNGQSGILINAADFGAETSAVGQELIDSIGNNFWRIYDYIIGKRAINSGDRAVDLSEVTTEMQTEANSINSDNLSTARGYKGEVKDVTGVSASDVTNNDKNNSEENDTNDPAQNSEKTAGITETDKAASANLDQVLQAKIRKGEGVDT